MLFNPEPFIDPPRLVCRRQQRNPSSPTQIPGTPRTAYAFIPPGFNPRAVNSAGPLLLGQWGDVRFQKTSEGLSWELDTTLRFKGPIRERKIDQALLLWQEFFLRRPSDWQAGREFIIVVPQSGITESAPGLLFAQAVAKAVDRLDVQEGVLLLQGTSRDQDRFVFTFALKGN
jgi:hypothetical protein